MNDWFTWNGTDCRDYGVRAVELPPISFAKERVTWKDIAGRSGSLALLEGDKVYEDLTLKCVCRVEDTANLSAIGAWLDGSGKVCFANRPEGYYKGRVSAAIEWDRITQGHGHREFTVTWRCVPFCYLNNSSAITIPGSSMAESGYTFTNPGTAASQPKITINGSGDFTISLGGQMVLLINVSSGIVLDSELMDALNLQETQLLNSQMSGDFFEIQPGANVISWDAYDENDNAGTVTSVTIEPRWRSR